MAEVEIVLQPIGGFDQDTSTLNAPPKSGGISPFTQGSYRYALNCRIGSSTKNNVGALENIASTLANATYYTWNGSIWVSGSSPAGTNKEVGKCEDAANGKIYWCVYNSNGNHQILMFSRVDNKIYELIKWSGLNFDLDHLVSMALINNWVGLTDYFNPPRILDLNSIYSLKFTLGSNFSEFHISYAKWAPAHPPIISAYPANGFFGSTAATPIVGTIQPRYFQFAYRLKYVGGFQSTWSPRSNFVNNVYTFPTQAAPGTFIQQFLVSIPQFVFDYNNPSNTAFDYSSVKFQILVEAIDIAYRETSEDTWKIFSTLVIANSPSTHSVLFDSINTGPQASVADADINQPFDTVPLLSKTIESIDNRFQMGNNLDDLPIESFDVSNVEVYTSQGTTDWSTPGSGFTGLSSSQRTQLGYYLNSKRNSFKEGGKYKLGIIFQNYAGRTSLVYSKDYWVYNIPYSPGNNAQNHALGFKIPNTVTPPPWAESYQIVRSNCLNIDFFGYGYVNNFRFLVSDTSVPNDPKAAPQGVQDILNNFYNNSTVVVPDGVGFDKNQLVPLTLTAFSAPVGGLFRKKKKRISANAAKGITPLASQLASFARHSLELNTSGTTSNAPRNCSLIYLEITNWALPTRQNNLGTISNPANNVFYNFQQGDRVRFLASTIAPSVRIYKSSELSVYDEEILFFDGTGIIVKKDPTILDMPYRGLGVGNSGTNNWVTDVGTGVFKIEVYHPKKFDADEEVIFHEMGEWYPISYPTTGSRDFTKRDFTWTNQAAVLNPQPFGFDVYTKMPIANGDITFFTKDFYWDNVGINNNVILNAFIPQMSPDPLQPFGDWDHNNGRPFVAYKPIVNYQQAKPNQVRFGNQYFQDGLFNGLNNMRDEWQKIYPAEYGNIRALINTSNTEVKSVGNILLAIGEEQAWSIYINRATLQDLSGNTLVSLSDKVLGSYNTLLGGYGTLNPESVSKNNGRVLWWCEKKGTWVRYSQDGLTGISREYNLANWFNDLSDLLISQYGATNNPKALSVYDNYHDTWVTLLDHSSLPSTFRGYSSYKCAEFSEDFDEWKTIFDYSADAFARLENSVYSIIGSTIHLHEGGADFGSFYGVKKDSIIEFIANALPRMNKIWEAISLHATDGWSFPAITGDFRSNNLISQQTRLLLTDLVAKEGVYWSEIKKDMNTPNAATPVDGIVNGNVMRSRALTLQGKLDPAVTWLSVLNYLVVLGNDSPKNVKK